MTDARLALAACGLVLLSIALPGVVNSIGMAQTTSISAGEGPTADPDGPITVAPGGNVTVTVWATATNVTAYQANLTFDPEVLGVATVSRSSEFEEPVATANDSAGWVAFNQLRSSEATDPVLAEVTFTVADGANGSTNVSFVEADVTFATEDGETFSPGEYRGVELRLTSSRA